MKKKNIHINVMHFLFWEMKIQLIASSSSDTGNSGLSFLFRYTVSTRAFRWSILQVRLHCSILVWFIFKKKIKITIRFKLWEKKIMTLHSFCLKYRSQSTQATEDTWHSAHVWFVSFMQYFLWLVWFEVWLSLLLLWNTEVETFSPDESYISTQVKMVK